jgi:EmrB/QacA subfamily drug resistance transporter
VSEPTQPATDGTWLGIERRWVTLIAVCGATFMLLVDVTIVQVALPTIQRELDASFSDLQWVIDAYALAMATLILTWGSTSDRFGRKYVFVLGLSVFTLASLLCGVSTTSEMLIWARALQGIGGAALFATGLALIGQEFSGAERGKAIAAWGATVGGAVAIGPLIGGILTSGLGWRSIFFVNVPVGLFTGWLAVTRMVNVSHSGTTRLDFGGLTTFSGSMFLLIFGLIRANRVGWTSTSNLVLFAGAAVLMVTFVFVERAQRQPMFDLTLFRKPSFTGVSMGTFAIGAGMFAMLPYITLYLQNDLGYSPLQGGLRLLPSSLLCFIVPIATRSAAQRFSARVLLATGLGITAAGLLGLTAVTATSSWTVLIPGLLLTGLGIGISNPAIAQTALGVVEPQRSGMASGISNTFRIGGLATGVAALGAIFQHEVTSSLADKLGHPAPQLARIVASGGVQAAVATAPHHPGLALAGHAAFVSAFRLILLVGALVVASGALGCLILVRGKDFGGHGAAAQAPATTPTAAEPSVEGLVLDS